MTEAEIIEAGIEAAGTVLTIFSIFLSVVTAYAAGLYFFINTAPLGMKLIAFFILSLAFLFLGAMGWNMQFIGEGIHTAWAALGTRSTQMEVLGPPLLVRSLFLGGRDLTAVIAWVVGGAVYVIFAYLTFAHRWAVRDMTRERF